MFFWNKICGLMTIFLFIGGILSAQNISFTELEDELLFDKITDCLIEGGVAGWFTGRAEFGPRALGNRSILADPRDPAMQKKLNLKIKNRESFRPFAPAICVELMDEYFELEQASPYMQFVQNVKGHLRKKLPENYKTLRPEEKLSIERSVLPAVTHVDFSARIQTVHEETNPRFRKLLLAFQSLTGCPVLVNTSFNVRGEPVVCSPVEAIRCFMNTEMDVLVLNDFLILKNNNKQE